MTRRLYIVLLCAGLATFFSGFAAQVFLMLGMPAETHAAGTIFAISALFTISCAIVVFFSREP